MPLVLPRHSLRTSSTPSKCRTGTSCPCSAAIAHERAALTTKDGNARAAPESLFRRYAAVEGQEPPPLAPHGGVQKGCCLVGGEA